MLATPADPPDVLPLDAATWAYEVKWDGMRALVDVREGALRILSRTERDVTVAFPELAEVAAAQPDVLLDAEIVVLRDGVPSFAALAERFHVTNARRAQALAATAPATLIAFDVLRLYGVDLTSRTWQNRREALERLAGSGQVWQLSPVYDDGAALLDATRERGLEGVMAKRRASTYHPGVRTPDWIKVAHSRFGTYLVGGWRPETGGADRIGAVLLGEWDSSAGGEPVLRFAGRVGSGIASGTELDLRRLLGPLRTASSPFGETLPRVDAAGAVWTRPEIVVEVRHKGHTDGGRLRQPVFRGIRPDVEPADVRAGG